jgi:hypothetical protein
MRLTRSWLHRLHLADLDEFLAAALAPLRCLPFPLEVVLSPTSGIDPE